MPTSSLTQGDAVVFPNLVPYAKWSSVSVYSPERHLLPLPELVPPLEPLEPYLDKDPAFKKRLHEEFEGDFRIRVNLAPQLFNARDPMTGRARKFEIPFGVISPAFTALAALRRVRGTPLDVFGKTRHRREERARIDDYERQIVSLLGDLNDRNYDAAVQIASVPETIRGYDSVKDESAQRAHEVEQQYLDEFAQATTR